ncbi:Peptidase E [Promicromonospora umidemergens]|uniref:Methyltransferase domain-containing protein n=1 Tax=Promicromonospora umidemergens TaxID=629679 RepID=A0ABP8WGX0_9MICO|nr:dipeptidase PepE [Promicromonospora umidemergens]MCP2285957.1 Peptidase E [Promicromonospora umidemergens]
MRLLLLSNSTNHAGGYLEHALDTVVGFLDGATVTFVPYALADHDGYTAKVTEVLASRGIRVSGLHAAGDPWAAVEQAEAVFVGGGNTFRLLDTLQRLDLLAPLAARVRDGLPYLGASAGTAIASPTIRTTNDMPITQPTSFEALGLVPVQLNAHYVDADPASTHGGETREERLKEFLEVNDVPVLGLREGTWLTVADGTARIGGTAVGDAAPGPAVVLTRWDAPLEVSGDVSELLSATARFDAPTAPSPRAGSHAAVRRPGDQVRVDPALSGAEFWEPLYRSAPSPTDVAPNVRLTEVVSGLAPAPGRACDLGCGHGGDALWLAALGWRVTAVDVSATAVDRVKAAAVDQGLADRVRTEQHDLSRSVPTGPFDLVYACYLHSPVTFDRTDLLRRAAQQVAPGGYLVLIDHASLAPWSWRSSDDEPVFPSPEETVDALALDDGWRLERCERSEREARGPDGTTAVVADDLIALRRTPHPIPAGPRPATVNPSGGTHGSR